MRVIIFTSSLELGGAEKHGVKLAHYFKNTKGYDTEVWVLANGAGDRSLQILCDSYGINTRIIGGDTNRIARFLFFRQISYFVPIFRSFRPDVIISFNLIPNLINALVFRKAGAKVGIWSQQSVNYFKPQSWIERKVIKNISAFISNSFHAAEALKKDLELPADKVFVVPNGIESSAAIMDRKAWLRRLSIKEEDFKAVMPANLTSTKDHLTLIAAWKIVAEELTKQGKRAVLVLAGRLGNTANEIVTAVQREELPGNVLICGPVHDIDGLNLAMDLGILSSPAEGLPNSLMENMLAGLPVVATDIAGIREVVGEDNYKYLSPVGNAEAMAKNILLFAENEGLRKQVGESNKKRITELFSLEKMNVDTAAVIEKLLKK